MKRIIVLFVGVFMASISFGQMTKDSLVKVMAYEVCESIKQKDLIGKSYTNVQSVLGEILLSISEKYSKELKELYGISKDSSNPTKGDNFAQDFGTRLAFNCPIYSKILTSAPEIQQATNDYKKIYKDYLITGTLSRISKDHFSFIEIKDSEGKIKKIWWFEQFTNSLLISTQPEKFINQKVTILFDEMKIYNSATKTYDKIKIITSIELDK